MWPAGVDTACGIRETIDKTADQQTKGEPKHDHILSTPRGRIARAAAALDAVGISHELPSATTADSLRDAALHAIGSLAAAPGSMTISDRRWDDIYSAVLDVYDIS